MLMKPYNFFFLLSILFASCGAVETESSDVETPKKTAKDIKIEALKTPCDCVDAMHLTLTEQASSEDSAQQVMLREILQNIEIRCLDSLNISRDSAKTCPSFERVIDLYDSINKRSY